MNECKPLAAGALLVREAGGRITDLAGGSGLHSSTCQLNLSRL